MRFEIPFDLPVPASHRWDRPDRSGCRDPKSTPGRFPSSGQADLRQCPDRGQRTSGGIPTDRPLRTTHCRVASTTTLPAGKFASIIWILTKMAALLSSCSTSIPQQPAGALTRSKKKMPVLREKTSVVQADPRCRCCSDHPPTSSPPSTFFLDRTSPGAHSLARAVPGGTGVPGRVEPSSASDINRLRQAVQSLLSQIFSPAIERDGGGRSSRAAAYHRDTSEAQACTLSPASTAVAGDRRSRNPCPPQESSIRRVRWPRAPPASRMLGRHGIEEFLKTSPDRLLEALRLGQALAAWNCGFEGARGGMYRMDKTLFFESIKCLVAGDTLHPTEPKSELLQVSLRMDYTCAACGGTAAFLQ